jgi:polyisoprenoid-binding protein YceI
MRLPMLLRFLAPLVAMGVATSTGTVNVIPATPAPAAMVTFNVDKAHSQVGFAVTHLGVSTVRGQFADYEASFQLDPQTKAAAAVTFNIKAASITTNNERRDGHLRSPDFFETEKFPEITFASTSVTKGRGDTYTVVGNLTMHGITKPVTLNATLTGVRATAAQGNTPAGFIAGATASGTIKRQDFGLTWSRMAEGIAMVSDDVKLEFEIEARGR